MSVMPGRGVERVDSSNKIVWRGSSACSCSGVASPLMACTRGRAKARGMTARIGFRFPDTAFVAEVRDGVLPVVRAEPEGCDATFIATAAPSLAVMFYVGMAAGEVGVTISGDTDAAARFMDLFELPDKIG